MLNGYGSTILEGAWLTLILALTSMAVAIVLGLLGAAFRLSPIKWLALLGETYATVIRGSPDLVLILLIRSDLDGRGHRIGFAGCGVSPVTDQVASAAG